MVQNRQAGHIFPASSQKKCRKKEITKIFLHPQMENPLERLKFMYETLTVPKDFPFEVKEKSL